MKISGNIFVGKDQNTRVELFRGFSGKNIVILPSPVNIFCWKWPFLGAGGGGGRCTDRPQGRQHDDEDTTAGREWRGATLRRANRVGAVGGDVLVPARRGLLVEVDARAPIGEIDKSG